MDDDSDSDYDRTKKALDLELEDRAVREEGLVQWQHVILSVHMVIWGRYCTDFATIISVSFQQSMDIVC